ncbi:3-hydroxyacyl-CoA dehydrogenase [Kurthia huakuii]|uniref:3-hydroxyacyl-CoA dehydrogenase n=1 Tax=Kurthia huakuii TaxID=1421019 RepID=UPI00049655A1|nr:3-hydroxyacyl-CoA dehydrogenase [Kurthia huakuii]MBM7698586.1 3-hydroxybutyryl-CoA dehydrogenase [Kurthia huakuii]
MTYKNVTVAGSGVLGSQIAFQTAFFGFNVTVYDINEAAIAKARQLCAQHKETYGAYFHDEARAEQAFEALRYSTDLADAVSDADLIVEAVPERLDIKQGFYEQLAQVAPAKTVFASNSSTMLPSQFAAYTGRPEKFLALHFANEIWRNNTAEIMGHAGTEKQYEEQVVEFAREIGMIPFHLHKEQPGYILNSLLVPFLDAGMQLWAKGVADPATIDKNWMIATGSPRGPFAILDVVGMETPYNLNLAKAAAGIPGTQEIADKLKAEYIDQGKMGINTGEGFYTYPNPAYAAADFLKK